MPFISPNATLLHYPSVVIANVRELIIATCETIVTLDAEVEGDLTGHSFLWEQIPEEQGGGFPVTWLEPQNQTMVTYDNQGVRDDKLFRFIIDAGLPTQKVSFLRCSVIPRDYLVTGQVFGNNTTSSLYLTSEAPTVNYIMPALKEPGTAYFNTPDRAIIFSSSTIDDSIEVELQKYINGVWTTVNSVDISSQIFNNIESNKVYRIVSRVRTNGVVFATSQPIAYAYPVTNGLNDYAITESLYINSADKNVSSSIIEYKPITLRSEVVNEQLLLNRTTNKSTASIQELKFLVKRVETVEENLYLTRTTSTISATILEIKPLQLITVG